MLDEVNLNTGADQVTWHLEASGVFSVKSMYAKLSRGATVAHYKDVWAAVAVLLKIIFSGQLILDKLPCSLQIASRHGLANGCCALCGNPENAAHIFFQCSLASFAWTVLRQLLGCNWRPANFALFHHIVSSLSGSPRRLLWLLFLAQSWVLWRIRNKLTIEIKFPNHPADIIYKMTIFLQLWSKHSKSRDQEGLCWMINELRELYFSARSSP
jgi:hypothetical protein